MNKELEFGWLKWGQKSGMDRRKYVEFYNRCSSWSNDCESPIECELYDKVTKLGMRPDVNSTLGDLLLKCKRDIAVRWIDDNAADRYDQIYFIKDKGRKVPILIVECDGKEDHTRIEDIKKDAKKEYNLSIHFPHVLFLRFSGSENYKSSDNCASVIKNTFDFVSSIYPLLKANPNMVRHLRNTAFQKLASMI